MSVAKGKYCGMSTIFSMFSLKSVSIIYILKGVSANSGSCVSRSNKLVIHLFLFSLGMSSPTMLLLLLSFQRWAASEKVSLS